MMESIEKLRARIYDSTLSNQTREELERIADEIEREIAERYMELPVDADGVSIHVGDDMESDNERFVVCAVALGRVHRWHVHNIGELDKGTVAYPPGSLHHYKPRTVEDVLEEFAHEWNDTHHDDMPALKAKYADELRGMIGGDAE